MDFGDHVTMVTIVRSVLKGLQRDAQSIDSGIPTLKKRDRPKTKPSMVCGAHSPNCLPGLTGIPNHGNRKWCGGHSFGDALPKGNADRDRGRRLGGCCHVSGMVSYRAEFSPPIPMGRMHPGQRRIFGPVSTSNYLRGHVSLAQAGDVAVLKRGPGWRLTPPIWAKFRLLLQPRTARTRHPSTLRSRDGLPLP